MDELDYCGKDHVGSKNYQLAEDRTSGEDTLNILEINFFSPNFYLKENETKNNYIIFDWCI